MNGSIRTSLLGGILFALGFSASLAEGADLTPYQPPGWSDKLVVSSTAGGHSDSTVYACQTAYLDVAVANSSSSDTGSSFSVEIWDDTTGQRLWQGNASPLAAGYYTYWEDIECVFKTAGTHTLRAKVDANGQVNESNEQNNTYTRQVTISAGDCRPDLIPYQLEGWSSELVVSAMKGSHADSTVYTCQKAYMDMAVQNNSLTGTGVSYSVEIWDDTTGQRLWQGNASPLAAGYYVYWEDIECVFKTTGTHTLRAKVDANGQVNESNEQNNTYSRQVTVSAGDCRPDLVPYQQESWQNKLVVYSEPVSSDAAPSDQTVYTYGPVYVAFGVANVGYTEARGFSVEVADLTEGRTERYTIDRVGTSEWVRIDNHPWVFTRPGAHTLEVRVDSNNDVAESEEGNNKYSRTVTVGTNASVTRSKMIPGAALVPSSVPLYVNDPNKYVVAGCTSCRKGICTATAIASILGYWDITPDSNGITYWNLVDNGPAPLRDGSPRTPEENTNQGDVAALVQTLARYYYVDHPSVESDIRARDAARSVAQSHQKGLDFAIEFYDTDSGWTKAALFDFVRTEIDANRPALWGVDDINRWQVNDPNETGHLMVVTGYTQFTTADLSMAFVHVNVGDTTSAYINWYGRAGLFEADTDNVITLVPGGTPQDQYEPDNTAPMAQPLDVDHPYQFRQTHNFALAGDVDWVKFQAVAGRKYRIETTNLGTACRTNVNLYGSDGTSLLVTSSNTMSPKPGSQIVWTCTQSGTFYVSVRHQDPLAQGPATNYDLQILQATP